jgi:hypothetical protein
VGIVRTREAQGNAFNRPDRDRDLDLDLDRDRDPDPDRDLDPDRDPTSTSTTTATSEALPRSRGALRAGVREGRFAKRRHG